MRVAEAAPRTCNISLLRIMSFLGSGDAAGPTASTDSSTFAAVRAAVKRQRAALV